MMPCHSRAVAFLPLLCPGEHPVRVVPSGCKLESIPGAQRRPVMGENMAERSRGCRPCKNGLDPVPRQPSLVGPPPSLVHGVRLCPGHAEVCGILLHHLLPGAQPQPQHLQTLHPAELSCPHPPGPGSSPGHCPSDKQVFPQIVTASTLVVSVVGFTLRHQFTAHA